MTGMFTLLSTTQQHNLITHILVYVSYCFHSGYYPHNPLVHAVLMLHFRYLNNYAINHIMLRDHNI